MSESILDSDSAAIVEEMKAREIEGAYALFRDLVREEMEKNRLNILKPYEDKVPQVLQLLDIDFMRDVLSSLEDHLLTRCLFGNFRVVEREVLVQIFEGLAPGKAARIFDLMSVGVDNPVKAARVLEELSTEPLREICTRVEPACLLRIMREMRREALGSLLDSLGPEFSADLIREDLSSRRGGTTSWNPFRLSRWRVLIRNTGHENDIFKLIDFSPVASEPPAGYNGKELKKSIEAMTAEEALGALLSLPRVTFLDVLSALETSIAARILTLLGEGAPVLAARALEEINIFIIVHLHRHDDRRVPVWEVYQARSAEIMAEMDFSASSSLAVLRALDGESLDMNLRLLPEDKKEEIIRRVGVPYPKAVPVSLGLFSIARGSKRTRLLDHGIKWTHITEELDVGDKIKPVVIDLLEMDPARIRIRACRAISEKNMISIAEVARILGEAKREGKRPDRDLFVRLGLIQLSRRVEETGALAGINGNHYFDYGHYTDTLKVGIDPAGIPGLYFGDPVGWFVSDGVEVSPPAFNRAALVSTTDGRLTILKVFMTAVALKDGRRITWDDINTRKKPGRIILYNSLFGFRTEGADTHVDVAVARGRVFAVNRGATSIPVTGFLLSVPVDQTERIANLRVGDPVLTDNNFPSSLGTVDQAMACGPHLVANRQMDLSFKVEDFGEKDSSVMAFSLTRAVETFEAARSFIFLRSGRLFLGTISGEALGGGTPTQSAGMTFGEMAQLCVDFQADDAYALDGGGSSSLVARDAGEVKVLNIPTGGSDVPRGEERFINTHFLVFERSRKERQIIDDSQ